MDGNVRVPGSSGLRAWKRKSMNSLMPISPPSMISRLSSSVMSQPGWGS